MKNIHYKRWIIRAPAGLVLTGFGLCLVAEAAISKFNGAPTLDWVLYGTFALVVFNSGLSIFGSAVVERVRHLSQIKLKDDLKPID